MQGIKTSVETKTNIVDQYIKGLEIKDIANLYNISQATVINVVKSLGIKARKQRFTANQELEIVQLYLESNLSSTEISKLFNTERTCIRNILNRNNVSKTYLKKHKLVRHNPFANLNDPETQYWLGMLAADGYTQDRSLSDSLKNRVSYVIGLVNCKDAYILDSYISFIGSNLKVYIDKPKEGCFPKATVSFCNKQVYDYLFELGYTPNKSRTLKINFPITWDFIRGVLDGDGWASPIKHTNGIKVGICSASFVFIKQLQSFFLEEGFTFSLYKKPEQQMYHLTITKQEVVYNLYNKLYNNNLPCITRKKQSIKTVADYYFNKVNNIVRP